MPFSDKQSERGEALQEGTMEFFQLVSGQKDSERAKGNRIAFVKSDASRFLSDDQMDLRFEKDACFFRKCFEN